MSRVVVIVLIAALNLIPSIILGNGLTSANSVIAFQSTLIISQVINDYDSDGVSDTNDNCVYDFNPNQSDSDMTRDGDDTNPDGIGDACDNCYNHPLYGLDLSYVYYPAGPDVYNPDQNDNDMDGWGNACDNCLSYPNITQIDNDIDGYGDACDNCPFYFNPSQYDMPFDILLDGIMGWDTTVCFGDTTKLRINGIPDCGSPVIDPIVNWYYIDPQGRWVLAKERSLFFNHYNEFETFIVVQVICGATTCAGYQVLWLHIDECGCDDAVSSIYPAADTLVAETDGTIFLRATGHGCSAGNPATYNWFELNTSPDNKLRGSHNDTITIRPLVNNWHYLIVYCAMDTACGDTDSVYLMRNNTFAVEPTSKLEFTLLNANPFSGELRMLCNLPTASPVKLNIYNLEGKLVTSLFNGELGAGQHSFSWDGKTKDKLEVPSGVYLIGFETPTYTSIERAIYLK